ncbi:uridylate kinase [Rickettsiales bacterium]|nr:uridylate kinase [Rickettsiales bacterium]
MHNYKRVLIKISGEALMGESGKVHNLEVINYIAAQIQQIHSADIQICLVVGGGNIYRGNAEKAGGIERASGDYIGMLATVINALAIQNAIEHLAVPCRVLSALSMTTICEPYIRRRAIRHLEKKRVVIFAAGTGNPFFSTDTAAALRAAEMGCDILMKATQVDGVYSADPKVHKNAIRFAHISYQEVISKDLRVMDTAAISLAKENNIPIIIFSLKNSNMLLDILKGKGVYTLIAD